MNQIHEGLEPWDWEQPESVELRTDPRTGTEDYFSTTAELRAQQSLHDKEQAKLTAQLEQDIRVFTTREISSVEDTYAVRSQYQDITSRLPLLDDGDLRASMLEQVENRYDYFTGIISQMGDTIALYEKQKAIDDARARKQPRSRLRRTGNRLRRMPKRTNSCRLWRLWRNWNTSRKTLRIWCRMPSAGFPWWQATRISRLCPTGFRQPSRGFPACPQRTSGTRPRPRAGRPRKLP